MDSYARKPDVLEQAAIRQPYIILQNGRITLPGMYVAPFRYRKASILEVYDSNDHIRRFIYPILPFHYKVHAEPQPKAA